MCGIAGVLNVSGALTRPDLVQIASEMSRALAHRGPDDHGVWVDESGYCALSHRRLAIIDPTPRAAQPMLRGTSCITFNGEIYNFRELRQDLESKGRHFDTRSDVEVLLAAIDTFGDGVFEAIDGMYAFATYDSADRSLLLARDPFGEKPLYYLSSPRYFAFASELSALTRLPGFTFDVDREALAQYLAFQYVPAPRSMYAGVKKLLPGHALKVTRDGDVRYSRHFSFRPHDDSSFAHRRTQDLADELLDILQRSVERRMVSDVPLGAFLSGGVDSSTIVALASRSGDSPLNTFTVGFDGSDSEHLFARRTAELFQTIHHERILRPEVVSLTQTIARRMDEPIGDNSCLPTYLLTRHARESVKTVLSGDGGDELFGGYGHYQLIASRVSAPSDKASAGDVYLSVMTLMREEVLEELLGRVPDETRSLFDGVRARMNSEHPLIHRLRELDADTFLPGSVLAKVDRMSMLHGLEVRCPFLSREMSRFAERLPADLCFEAGEGKRILKTAAARYLPMEWLTRSKTGFNLPTGFWQQSHLIEIADMLSAESHWLVEEWLDPRSRARFVQRQRLRETFEPGPFWALLLLELWLRAQAGRLPKSATFGEALSVRRPETPDRGPLVLLEMSPNSVVEPEGFNVQPDGASAISIRCADAGPWTEVVFAGSPLVTTFGDKSWLTAIVPLKLLLEPGSHPVFLRDGERVSNALQFEVREGATCPYRGRSGRRLRIRIVCYDITGGWIAPKLARRLRDELRAMAVAAEVADTPDPSADINHHLVYVDFLGTPSRFDTVMVTHVDDLASLRLLRRQLEGGVTGVCMSRDTMERLERCGLPVQRLCYISPAHDGVLRPRPLLIGICTRLYEDGRKHEQRLLELAKHIRPEEFRFVIIGSGWDRIVDEMRKMRFSVEHHPRFEMKLYLETIRSLDYYLYWAMDEGSMGFLDAVAAGVPTIASPQGFHLDVVGGLTHPASTLAELVAVFDSLARPRRQYAESVAAWTWANYARNHLAVWNAILADAPIGVGSFGENVSVHGRLGIQNTVPGRLSLTLDLARVSFARTRRSFLQRFRNLIRE